MEYKLEDLSPCPHVLVIGTREIELEFLTLRNETIFIEKFGNVQAAFNAVNKDATKIFEVIWIFIKDKSIFLNSIDEFKKYCFKNEKLEDIGKKLKEGIDKTISKSMPLIVNEQRIADLQKINDSQTDSKPCYARYFDTIAARYGHSIEDFYKITLRQLHIFLHTIGDKSYEELELQAALHGRNLKPRLKMVSASPEEEKDQEAEAREAFKRLQQEYLKNKQDKK